MKISEGEFDISYRLFALYVGQLREKMQEEFGSFFKDFQFPAPGDAHRRASLRELEDGENA